MSTRGTGKAWEAAVAAEMQWLWDRRARFYKLFKLDQFLEDLIEWLTVK